MTFYFLYLLTGFLGYSSGRKSVFSETQVNQIRPNTCLNISSMLFFFDLYLIFLYLNSHFLLFSKVGPS